jgi:alkylated DNA repair dioxygenase AlkB
MAWNSRLNPPLFETIQLPSLTGETMKGVSGELLYAEHFLLPSTADEAFHTLMAETAWQQEKTTVYGTLCDSPRLTAWYGDPAARYGYSGIAHDPLPWIPCLQELRRQVENAVAQPFNSVLLNLYRDGNDSVGWHSDNEPELGVFPCIASLSLGQTRRFLLKPRRASGAVARARELALQPGSLLVMRGRLQQDWKHAVPKEKKVTRPRINLTFRRIEDRAM